MIADATARAGAEWKVSHAVRRRTVFGSETQWIELLRVRPVALAPMKMKYRHNHVHAHGNIIAAERIGFRAAPTDRPDCRINSQRFLNHLAHVSERENILIAQPFRRPMRID